MPSALTVNVVVVVSGPWVEVHVEILAIYLILDLRDLKLLDVHMTRVHQHRPIWDWTHLGTQVKHCVNRLYLVLTITAEYGRVSEGQEGITRDLVGVEGVLVGQAGA